MTEKVLLSNGYKECEVPSTKYANRFFQKKIRDKKGIKYFINVYEYEIQNSYNYEFELYSSKDKFYIKTLIYGIDNMAIEEIEKEIENIWTRCNFDYYELN